MYKAGTVARLKKVVLGILLPGCLSILFPFISNAAGSVNLAWDSSPDAGVAGYNVYYGTGSRSYQNEIPTGTNLTAAVSGLAGGQTYYFAVTAVDASGLESDFSGEVTYSVPQTNSPPTISAIPNQVTSAGQATPALSFTIGDAQTAASSLTLSAVSSVPTLVPNANIVFGGSGQNRTVTVTPAAGQTGKAQITISVSDGTNSASSSFTLTVQQTMGNTPPTISAISPQTGMMNQTTAAIPFTIGDAETPASSLTLSAASSNPTLAPTANIVFGGSGQNRTVTITPATGQSGSAQITISVSDGTNSASSAFTLTIQQSNMPPTISAIGNQIAYVNHSSNPIGFTINDTDTPLANLTLSGASSNTSLVPNASIVFSGTGQNRTVTITPAAGQTGSAQITITVSDGLASAQSTFTLSVQQTTALLKSDLPKSSTYNGLFYEDDAVRLQSAGAFKVTVTSAGTYSGSLQMAAGKYSFNGVFGVVCQATNLVLRKGTNALSISFMLQADASTNQFLGNLSDGVWVAGMHGAMAPFNSKTNPAPYAGNYTIAIPGQTNSPSLGNGYGSVRVDGNGNARLTGMLADGTKISQSALLSQDGLWPVFVPLYSGKGLVMAWISFTNRTTDDLNGAVNWIKLANPSAIFYPDGLVFAGSAIGSAFNPGSALALNVEVSKLQTSSSAPGNITTLKISPTTGTFKGSLLNKLTGQPTSFQGALLQKPNTAYGFILGTGQSTPLMLVP